MSAKIYDDYLDYLRSLDNVTVAHDGENIERFTSSSGMITDSVSFLAEYIPSGRPLLFLERADRARFSDAGENIISAHYRGRGMRAIHSFVTDICEGHDPLAERRQRIASQELNIGSRSATDQIMAELTAQLC